MSSGQWPYYIDDPLVDRDAHRLGLHADEDVPAPGAMFGTCSCGEWTTPTWDVHGVMEAFDHHMELVQVSAHAAGGGS